MKLNSAAFTLIELLVVVLIIGILASIAVPQYQLAVTKSRYATMKNLAVSIAQAQTTFYLANGEYSSRFDALDVDAGGSSDNTEDTKRNYNWGSCGLDIQEQEAYIICENTQISMWYQFYFQQVGHPVLKARCIAISDDNIANRICQQETQSRGGNSVLGRGYWY